MTETERVAFLTRVLGEAPHLGWRARVLHPEHISNCMLRREKYNLNQLSYDTVFDIVASLLGEGLRIEAAFVDTLGKPEKYQAILEKKFPTIRFTVRSKADVLYPVVGAASIVAKVLRDDIIRAMGVTEASGYPGDAATVAWLRAHVDPIFGFPSVVRFSWSSCAELLRERCVSVIWCDSAADVEGGEAKANKENSRSRKRPPLPPPGDIAGLNTPRRPFNLTSNIQLMVIK